MVYILPGFYTDILVHISMKDFRAHFTRAIFSEFSKFIPYHLKVHLNFINSTPLVDEMLLIFLTSDEVRDQARDAHYLICHACFARDGLL